MLIDAVGRSCGNHLPQVTQYNAPRGLISSTRLLHSKTRDGPEQGVVGKISPDFPKACRLVLESRLVRITEL